MPLSEFRARLDEHGVPCGLIYTASDMMEDAHFAARDAIVEVTSPEFGALRVQNVAPRLSETPGAVRHVGPAPGEHNDEALGGLLGPSEEARADHRERGIVRWPKGGGRHRARRAEARGGVDGTFTDLLLLDPATGRTTTAKVPSTPEDSSHGVPDGIERVCALAGVEPGTIGAVMHGTTVATNAVLTGTDARVRLAATLGHRDVLRVARSHVPGGLGGRVIWNKRPPLAPPELTIEAHERIGADGAVVEAPDEDRLRRDFSALLERGVEALTVALLDAYASDRHERRMAEIAAAMAPDGPRAAHAGAPDAAPFRRCAPPPPGPPARPPRDDRDARRELLPRGLPRPPVLGRAARAPPRGLRARPLRRGLPALRGEGAGRRSGPRSGSAPPPGPRASPPR